MANIQQFLDSRRKEKMYADQQLANCAQGTIGQYQPPTIRQRLTEQKDALESQLTIVNKALEALDAHPDFEQFTDILRKANL